MSVLPTKIHCIGTLYKFKLTMLWRIKYIFVSNIFNKIIILCFAFFSYHGKLLNRFGSLTKRPRKDYLISTIFDDPETTDPVDPLLRRHDEYTKNKWRTNYK